MTLYKVQLPEGHFEATGMQDANWQNAYFYISLCFRTMPSLL